MGTHLESKAKIFQQEALPNVLKVYNFREKDDVFVDPNNSGDYISFEKYLNSILKQYDRTVEEARIRKKIGWNE